MSISFGFDTAVSGLSANQKALEVTGHNVANLATPGFARQSVLMKTAATRRIGNWHVEMGVDLQQVRQIRHSFNDNIYRAENNKLGYWESRNKAVIDIESILGEPIQQGFQVALNNFWDSFQELSKAPESLTIRALVKQRTDSLTNYLNQVGSQINKLQTDINTEIRSRIDEVNDITQEIAALNVRIMSAEAAGNAPNDYYDQRNALCDSLSKLVDVETWETRDGSMDILVNGYFLVSKGERTMLLAEPDKDYSHFYAPMIKTRDGSIPINVGSGIIRGLLEARGEVSGAKGSYENGSPNTTADITIAVDVSNTDPDYYTNIQTQIDTLQEDLQSRGVVYNIRTIEYNGNDFDDVIDTVNNNSYADGINKYLMVFTHQSINGDGSITTDEQISDYLKLLNKNNFSVSVATDPTYFEQGDAGEKGWDILTGQTGGTLYESVAGTDFGSLMKRISDDVNKDINTKMATSPDNLNVISSVRKQLNALINIMAREVNRIHLSGKTLDGEDGGLFFEPIDPSLPMELGNIKVSDNLKDLNKIAASQIDANGDNRIALEIAMIRNKNLMTGNRKVLSLDTYYQNIILEIGNKGYEARSMSESYQSLVTQADSMRQSVMGVSLDEEMTNMIKFKYAYNANAKVIDVVNQMLETVMHRLGAS